MSSWWRAKSRNTSRKPNKQTSVIRPIVFFCSLFTTTVPFCVLSLFFTFFILYLFQPSVFSSPSTDLHIPIGTISYQLELLNSPFSFLALMWITHQQSKQTQAQHRHPVTPEPPESITMAAGGVVTRFLPSDAPLLELRCSWWGCRRKVTGQDVAVTPFLLLMCSSVPLATALREVVLLKWLREGEGERMKGWSVHQQLPEEGVQRKGQSLPDKNSVDYIHTKVLIRHTLSFFKQRAKEIKSSQWRNNQHQPPSH